MIYFNYGNRKSDGFGESSGEYGGAEGEGGV